MGHKPSLRLETPEDAVHSMPVIPALHRINTPGDRLLHRHTEVALHSLVVHGPLLPKGRSPAPHPEPSANPDRPRKALHRNEQPQPQRDHNQAADDAEDALHLGRQVTMGDRAKRGEQCLPGKRG